MREPGSSHHPEDCQAYFSGLLPLACTSIPKCIGAKQENRCRVGFASLTNGGMNTRAIHKSHD